MPIFTKYFCNYKLDENNILLLNTLTSAIDIVDYDTMELLNKLIKKQKDINSIGIDKKLYDKLKQRGYIYESEEDEKSNLSKFKKMIELTSAECYKLSPIEFIICPTMGCNLMCTYCFEEEKYRKNLEVMSEKKLETLFKYIKQRNEEHSKLRKNSKIKLPNLTIKLFGGEPLLKNTYSIVKKIFEFADQNHIGVYIITNGTNIDDIYFELLKKYNKMLKVQITLDGCKKIHDLRRVHADGSGSFDQVCKGIQKVLDSKTKLFVRINVDRENIYSLTELEELFEKRGWLKEPLFIPYVSPVTKFKADSVSGNIMLTSEMLKTLADDGLYDKKNSFLKDSVVPSGEVIRFFNFSNKESKPWKVSHCEATSGRSFCFAPNGTIVTCVAYAGCKEQAIGHFDESGVAINQNKLRKWTHRSPFNIEKCKDCKFILFCGGGCPVESIEKGDINCPSCIDIEKTIEVYATKYMKDKLLAEKRKRS